MSEFTFKNIGNHRTCDVIYTASDPPMVGGLRKSDTSKKFCGGIVC